MNVFFNPIVSGSRPVRTDRNKLSGNVYVDGIPARRKIAVFDRETYILVATKWSDPITGSWSFEGLPEYPENSLIVMMLDDPGCKDWAEIHLTGYPELLQAERDRLSHNSSIYDFVTQVV